MNLQRLVNVFAFISAFYFAQKLGVLNDVVKKTDNNRSSSDAGDTEKLPPKPVEKNTDPKSSFFTEEDKRRMQRTKEDLEKKFCTKHGLCEPPPPKPLTESISDALYDTWLAVKKIPSYWKRTADSMVDTICRWFNDD